MIKRSDDIAPLFNVSTLSRNYYYNCEKNYYNLLSRGKKADLSKEQSANSSEGQTKKENSQGNSSKKLAELRGDEFEKKLYESLIEKRKIEETKDDFREALRDDKSDYYLYNQEFTVDNAFYNNLENSRLYRIAKFRPDFVHVTTDEKTKRKKIRIIEAKSSKDSEETHKIQVVSYWFLIKHLIENTNIVLDKQVGIWLPSDEENPKLFDVDSMIEKVDKLYKTTLPNIIKSGKYMWDLQKKCHGCDYYNDCKKDAKGTVKELPYNNKKRYDYYEKYKLEYVEDIEDLAGRMQRMSLNEQDASQLNIRLQGYADCRKPRKKPVFFGFPTTLVSKNVDHPIYVSFLKDDFTYNPYAFAFHIPRKVKLQEELTYCLNKSYYKKTDKQQNDAFCDITERFIKALYSILDYMNREKKRCLFYVYDNNEMYNIKNFLSELVSSQGKHLKAPGTEIEKIVKKATKCLVALFQDSTLLDVPTLKDLPCLDKIEKNTMIKRFAVIEQLLEQNVALPAQVYYEVSDAVKWMVGPEAVVHKFKEEWEIFSTNEKDGDQFAKETKDKQLELLKQLHKVMEKYWELADNKAEVFPLPCLEFKWPGTFDCNTFGCNDQILARILYFTEYIRLFKQRQCQGAPIDDLDIICGYKTSSNLSSLTLKYKGSEDGKLMFDIDITGYEDDIKKRLENLEYDNKNGYNRILVPDTYEASTCYSLKEVLLTVNLHQNIVKMFKYMHNLGTFEKGLITNVTYLTVNMKNRTVELKACLRPKTPGQRFRLYKTYEKKNEKNPFKNMFEEIDEDTKDSIVNLLQDPNAWSTKDPFDDINFNLSETQESLNRSSMSYSQKEAVKRFRKRRLQLIWGSGDVKKQFLARFINWYISNFIKRNQSADLIIGVAANRADSTLNLLQEVEKIQGDNEFTIICVGKPPEKSDEKSKIKYTSDIQNFNVTKCRRVLVVGARFSNWEYVKKRKNSLNCRMMIIDDGSKMHVPDALLPLACLSSTHCKLIVAGDINGKKPFSYGYYQTTTSGNSPLLYGSIQQCLTKTNENVVIEIDGKVNSMKDLGPNTWKLDNSSIQI